MSRARRLGLGGLAVLVALLVVWAGTRVGVRRASKPSTAAALAPQAVYVSPPRSLVPRPLETAETEVVGPSVAIVDRGVPAPGREPLIPRVLYVELTPLPEGERGAHPGSAPLLAPVLDVTPRLADDPALAARGAPPPSDRPLIPPTLVLP